MLWLCIACYFGHSSCSVACLLNCYLIAYIDLILLTSFFSMRSLLSYTSLDYVGRTDCEDTGRECLDENSISRECRQDLGDAHALPDSNLLVHEILAFFADNFGFNAQETVALMGVSNLVLDKCTSIHYYLDFSVFTMP